MQTHFWDSCKQLSRGMGVACRLLDDWRIVLDIAILDSSQIFDILSNIHVA